MITVTYTVLGAQEVSDRIRALAPAILGNLKTALDQWSEELASYIQSSKLSGDPINARTGKLRNSVNPYRRDEGAVLTGGAGAGAGVVSRDGFNYAKGLEYGTRAHGPVTAKALRFTIDGRLIFAKWVRGVPPFRYMGTSFEEESPKGIEALKAAVREAMTA